ncbi:MAG: RibD family protein, partial [Solirubrobacteraceae bacterium]
GISSILLEGGPHLAGAFFDAAEIDEIRLFLAPLVLGGRTARDPLEGEGVDAIADAMRALTLDCRSNGDDLLISARMKEW